MLLDEFAKKIVKQADVWQQQLPTVKIGGYEFHKQKTLEQLKKMKMDLSVMRQDKWQNREVYVVGAKQGDLRSKSVKMLAVKIK